MKPLPITVDELISELDQEYPERCPGPRDTERAIWMNAGKRELVRNLLRRKEITEEKRAQAKL